MTSTIGKIIAFGNNRKSAMTRMENALKEIVVEG